MNKIFVDTNILIYAYSSTELKKRQLSLDILSGDNIIISTQVINEFIWVMQCKFSIDLKLINQVVKGLFISYRAGIIDQEIITKAISISGKYGFRIGIVLFSRLLLLIIVNTYTLKICSIIR